MKYSLNTNKPNLVKNDNNHMTIDIDNRIIIVNEIDTESTTKFINQFCEIQNSGQEIIPIYINSYGGCVEDVLGMVDLIKSSNSVVATIALGKAMSAGAVLLSAGTNGFRFISPHSTIMIHDISAWNGGKMNDILINTKELTRLDNVLFSVLDQNCNKKSGYFKNLLKNKEHADIYMSPKDAIKHSLADKIRIPNFSVNINVDFVIS